MAFNPHKPREYGSTKEIVGQLIDAAGGVKNAAFVLERSPTLLYSFSDPQADAQISLDAARRLAASCETSILAEDFAAIAGGVFMPVEPCADPLAELSAKSAEEHGELMGALVRACSDGVVDHHEAREILQECDQHLRAVVALRAKLVSIATKGS